MEICTLVFKKVFIQRDIYRQIYTFVFLHVRPCVFSLVIVQLVKKLGSTIFFFSSGSLFQFEKNMSPKIFLSLEKCIRPAITLQYKFARTNYLADFGTAAEL